MTPVIYADLDGVVCNFVSGAIAHHGSALRHDDAKWGLETQMGIEPTVFWSGLGKWFWQTLQPYPDGFALLTEAERMVGADNIALLSSPCDTDGCCDGKRAWVRKHLPAYSRRLILGGAKYLLAGPNKVLVDDFDGGCDKFREAGGHPVQPPRPWNRRAFATIMPGGAFNVGEVTAELEYVINVIREK